MHEGDEVAEPCAEEPEYLRRERDLGHEHDGGLSPLEHTLDDVHIHFRLAAPRHSVQQEDAFPFRDGVNGVLLILGESDGFCGSRERFQRDAGLVHRALFHKAPLAKSVHDARPETLHQHREIFPFRRREKIERFLLFRRTFQRRFHCYGVQPLCRSEIDAFELRIPFLAQFCGDEEAQDVDVAEVVSLPHRVHELELLERDGSVEIGRFFEIGKIRLLLLPYDEPDGAPTGKFHRNATAERHIVALVVERSVYLGSGDVDDDFKHHNFPAPRRG